MQCTSTSAELRRRVLLVKHEDEQLFSKRQRDSRICEVQRIFGNWLVPGGERIESTRTFLKTDRLVEQCSSATQHRTGVLCTAHKIASANTFHTVLLLVAIVVAVGIEK